MICIATLPWTALLALSVSIELVSSSARVTSVKSTQGLCVSDGHLDTKIGPGTPGSDKNMLVVEKYQIWKKMQQQRKRFIFQRIFSLITMKAKCTGETNIYPHNVKTVVQHWLIDCNN